MCAPREVTGIKSFVSSGVPVNRTIYVSGLNFFGVSSYFGLSPVSSS